MTDDTKRPLRVFLCHASADKPKVRKLYSYLKKRGVQPWLDKLDLLPGQDWPTEIPKVIFSSDVIVVCLSKNSVNKDGYVQREIVYALDKAMEKPEGMIFIIPAKLEECDVPSRLSRYHWVDLFQEGGHKQLMKSLNILAASLSPSITQGLVTDDSHAEVITSPSPDNVATAKLSQEDNSSVNEASSEQLPKEFPGVIPRDGVAQKREKKEGPISGKLSSDRIPSKFPQDNSSGKLPPPRKHKPAVRKSIAHLEDKQPTAPSIQGKLSDMTAQALNVAEGKANLSAAIEDQEELNEKLPAPQSIPEPTEISPSERMGSKPTLSKFKKRPIVTVAGIVIGIVLLAVVGLRFLNIWPLIEPTPTASATQTELATSTLTITPTLSQTSSPAATFTRTRTATPTLTATQTPTRTRTPHAPTTEAPGRNGPGNPP
jgi:TIR domain-containing protein